MLSNFLAVDLFVIVRATIGSQRLQQRSLMGFQHRAFMPLSPSVCNPPHEKKSTKNQAKTPSLDERRRNSYNREDSPGPLGVLRHRVLGPFIFLVGYGGGFMEKLF
jgi:hypothetical protein